jgi:hypothetical protein
LAPVNGWQMTEDREQVADIGIWNDEAQGRNWNSLCHSHLSSDFWLLSPGYLTLTTPDYLPIKRHIMTGIFFSSNIFMKQPKA